MKNFLTDEPLAKYTTYEIGGQADYFAVVKSTQELAEVLKYCKKHQIPFHILGKGSNSLFDDRGFRGLVIHNKIHFCEMTEREIHVGAGYSFSHLGVKTARLGLSGLEFASGIPGSVGGAIYMNAGANGAETCDVLTEVTFVNAMGEIEIYTRDQLTFSYRTSPFHHKKGAICEAKFLLQPSEEARQKQVDFVTYRTQTQPYNQPSCGCVFRNPKDNNAGKLIEECGLKGVQMGGAEVSSLHANFIVNRGGAQAKDILLLAKYVQSRVKEHTGLNLELELKQIPEKYET